ncbi:KH domain-containing protein [Collinsella sp. AGMB00827]|uniref:RNA-binding protein KhpA n=1 Tax=Collinsella ureilytica TaxID=2869515 RepID=A0ABS7ML11_9ACTN|nr:KH domain-containing protein [Collinsella urealyticum]
MEDTEALNHIEELPSDRVADLVEYLVVNIVDDPAGVTLEVVDDEQSSTIEITVSDTDTAKVIGRHGRTIQAIRTLARALAARLGISVDIEVLG